MTYVNASADLDGANRDSVIAFRLQDLATPIVSSDSTVSLDDIARELWWRMIEKDLLAGTDGSWRCP